MSAPRFWFILLLLGSTILRMIWAALLEASNDEAYHYLYTVHLDWSYFDHPPMTGWLARLGILVCGGAIHPFSLRLAFILVFAGSNLILYAWASRWYGERAGLAAALCLNLSAYFTAAGGVFALPDGPFLFFALFTMWQLSEALLADRAFSWIWVGLGFGGALLSKYHGIFLPAGAALFILLTPGTRHHLLRVGPYLAVVLGFLCFSPVIFWNATHDWASFKFQGGRAIGMRFRPEGLLAWLGGPIVYLMPWIWYAVIQQLLPRLRRFSHTTGIERLLVCLSLAPLSFFLMVSLVRWVLLHWNLIGFVPMYLLVGKAWAELAEVRERYARNRLLRMTAGLVCLLALAFGQARFGLIPFPGKDPTADISGWESVTRELEKRGILDEPNSFLFTNRWYDSGQLAFTTAGRIPVACYNSIDARGFAFWSRPEDWVGKTGYMIVAEEPDEVQVRKEFESFFTRIEKVGEFRMDRGGHPFRPVTIYRCVNQKHPYPFTYKLQAK